MSFKRHQEYISHSLKGTENIRNVNKYNLTKILRISHTSTVSHPDLDHFASKIFLQEKPQTTFLSH
jgi:hypothetical protein